MTGQPATTQTGFTDDCMVAVPSGSRPTASAVDPHLHSLSGTADDWMITGANRCMLEARQHESSLISCESELSSDTDEEERRCFLDFDELAVLRV
eukprot:2728712-Lingulodinium_polyedra.AAC.1